MTKIEIEGKIFALIEEEKDGEIIVCAEIGGVNIWDWIQKRNGKNVKVILEEKENEKENKN